MCQSLCIVCFDLISVYFEPSKRAALDFFCCARVKKILSVIQFDSVFVNFKWEKSIKCLSWKKVWEQLNYEQIAALDVFHYTRISKFGIEIPEKKVKWCNLYPGVEAEWIFSLWVVDLSRRVKCSWSQSHSVVRNDFSLCYKSRSGCDFSSWLFVKEKASKIKRKIEFFFPIL